MTKIIHICNNYIYSNLYNELITRLDKEYENKVFAAIGVGKNHLVRPQMVNENIKVVECFSPYDRFFYKMKSNKIFNALLKTYDPTDFDIVHAHTLFTDGNVAYNLYKKSKIPYVITVRSTDIKYFFKYYKHLKNLGNDILMNASKVIFLSESYKEKMIEKYVYLKNKQLILEKSIVIPNGVDPYFLNNLMDQTAKERKSQLILLTVGRIERNKNQLMVCKALDELRTSGLEFSYQLVGQITDEKYMDKIKKYSFVDYLGSKNKEDLISIYSNADIFILPSKSETFGLSYAEAISQNTPVIYSKNEGFDKQFEEGVVGYSVNSNSKEEIKSRINKMILDLDSFQGISEYSKEFDWDKISNKISEVYSKIIDNGVECEE
ncbi:glycosyltransferase family 4 protein [Enterococcus mundtii]|uniref:glycosyltransferase family 4 protein n=1 Tax=Enterococcus mundtii TaxID=53346 RepID=UPI002DC06028|nr:glycosyltransferase family 4 protein [Enterococcus mundtii]MEC3940318.1 glycosyltransferase family 4 protein [Enterococcus mundtii]